LSRVAEAEAAHQELLRRFAEREQQLNSLRSDLHYAQQLAQENRKTADDLRHQLRAAQAEGSNARLANAKYGQHLSELERMNNQLRDELQAAQLAALDKQQSLDRLARQMQDSQTIQDSRTIQGSRTGNLADDLASRQTVARTEIGPTAVTAGSLPFLPPPIAAAGRSYDGWSSVGGAIVYKTSWPLPAESTSALHSSPYRVTSGAASALPTLLYPADPPAQVWPGQVVSY
jgi:hypothetical protein